MYADKCQKILDDRGPVSGLQDVQFNLVSLKMGREATITFQCKQPSPLQQVYSVFLCESFNVASREVHNFSGFSGFSGFSLKELLFKKKVHEGDILVHAYPC